MRAGKLHDDRVNRLGATRGDKPRLLARGAENLPAGKPRAVAGLQALAAIALLLAAAAVAFFLVLILTVLAAVRIPGGMWLIHRAPWAEGKAPAPAIALALSSPVDRGFVGRLSLLAMGDDRASIVKIVAGPGTHLDSRGNVTTALTNNVLTDTYKAQCIEGACEPGATLDVPIENVLGEVMDSSLPGFSRVTMEGATL